MTYKEKLQEEHPEFVGKNFVGGCRFCPETFGYEKEMPLICKLPIKSLKQDAAVQENRCRKCWEREIEE